MTHGLNNLGKSSRHLNLKIFFRYTLFVWEQKLKAIKQQLWLSQEQHQHPKYLHIITRHRYLCFQCSAERNDRLMIGLGVLVYPLLDLSQPVQISRLQSCNFVYHLFFLATKSVALMLTKYTTGFAVKSNRLFKVSIWVVRFTTRPLYLVHFPVSHSNGLLLDCHPIVDFI